MNNTDIINSYNTRLTENNLDLDDIIATINNLPEAGGGGITPTGTITIDENGTYDVTNYASANVDIDIGVFPAGAMEITENGPYDVTDFAVVDVNVPTGGDTTIEDSIVTRTITSYTNNRITLIGNHAFRGSKITSINCSNVTSIEAYGLDSCSSLVDVNLPKVNSLKNYAMQNCKALVRLEFQQKITTQGAVWLNCSALTTLVLRGSTMSALGNKNCFNGTPIASGTGYIYVPDNLVDTYKANTNWANYANQIKGLSELPS